ncbi:hypothetical protein RH824_004543 [Vibrio parahaemolyticus]|uniref:hypothetical protein n=1 Tax=Vibrio parahaemolyticus TaxID=670 RepID=UPI00084B93EF|nr:hypothetical protein [Vibrio parahaemolyticus]EGQ8527913.1 hypothetical protein [Vibrio parahaemolyticus]EGQ9211924.1 hypothetical protein [Vibrio parahaemolyticus]EGQ9789699.1 hypothetical protein [Vibrio parahaemolyticus]EGQ9926388.1 hypothetical protein [Vibrio parahaemolyticus]EGR0121206.1 hypothetical protein [Vibrio parahaemolyticus]
MPIKISDIVTDGVYETDAGQQRKVTKIDGGRVHYLSRGKDPSKPWSPGHTIANPPTLSTFANACASVLSKP